MSKKLVRHDVDLVILRREMLSSLK